MKLVLDADLLIGALDGSDRHHKEARALFTAWQNQDATRLISVVNLSEVLVAPAADRHCCSSSKPKPARVVMLN